MGLNDLIDKLNNELDKLEKLKNSSTVNSFFTDNENFNDDFPLDLTNNSIDNCDDNCEIANSDDCKELCNENLEENLNYDINKYNDIEPDNETKVLVTIKEKRLLAAQNMFKKSIRVSLKSFLISLTLSFLNLFI